MRDLAFNRQPGPATGRQVRRQDDLEGGELGPRILAILDVLNGDLIEMNLLWRHAVLPALIEPMRVDGLVTRLHRQRFRRHALAAVWPPHLDLYRLVAGCLESEPRVFSPTRPFSIKTPGVGADEAGGLINELYPGSHLKLLTEYAKRRDGSGSLDGWQHMHRSGLRSE